MRPGTPRFALRLGVVVLRIRDEQLCLLLTRGKGAKSEARWTLPGGYLGPANAGGEEQMRMAALREVERETGHSLEPSYFTQLGTFALSASDELLLAYLAVVRAGSRLSGTGSNEAEWLQVGLVLDDSLRSDAGIAQAVKEAVERVRELAETTALGLAFCEEPFTIPTLRRAFEAVWGLPSETLDPGAFHRRLLAMRGLIEQVGSEERTGPGRPAALYRAGPLVRGSGPAARLERRLERPWQPAANEALKLREAIRLRVDKPSGLSAGRWERLLREARGIIWDVGDAKRPERLIAYGDLATQLDMHVRSAAFFEALDALCIEESLVGGPMITALVYNKQTKLPGQRFFILAERLGRQVDDLTQFVEDERRRVYEWIAAHPERSQSAHVPSDSDQSS